MNLQPWRLSGMLTHTRTIGEVCLRINGTALDIWVRVDGQPRWFAVDAKMVASFLRGVQHGEEIVLRAESDGNAETGLRYVPGRWEPVNDAPVDAET